MGGISVRQYFDKYKHFLLILYFPFYLLSFRFLETMKPDEIHIIDCALDQYIPFIEVFIIPYILWFAFMGVTGFYFLFRESKSFVKMMYFGMAGMTLFLFISYIYPNGLDLRPEVFPRENIFTDLVRMIYSNDTSTNVLPSIHVFNSVGVCCAIHYSEKLRRHPAILKGSTVLTVLIILSTMFVKQHSIVDVVTGLALSYIMWELVYNKGVERLQTAIESYQQNARTARYGKKRVPIK